MKKAKTVKKPVSNELPFSFLKKEIGEAKTNAHWTRIKEKIEQQSIGETNPEENK